jgi:hypothetical protein
MLSNIPKTVYAPLLDSRSNLPAQWDNSLLVGAITASALATLLPTETAGMFLGRLEFFTIVIGLIKLMADIPPLLGPKAN